MARTLFERPRASLRGLIRKRLRLYLEGSFLRRHLFWRIRTTLPYIALTFDDGPHPDFTPRILDTLRAAGAHATFFVIGREARQYPDIIRRIVQEGHTLGCHTDTHADLSRLGLRASWRECRNAQRDLESIAGRPIFLLRPPWGRMRASTMLVALANNLAIAFWSIDSLDYRHLPPAEMLAHLQQNNLAPGDVLLFHDDGENTVLALPRILDYLQTCGLGCSSIRSLLDGPDPVGP